MIYSIIERDFFEGGEGGGRGLRGGGWERFEESCEK